MCFLAVLHLRWLETIYKILPCILTNIEVEQRDIRLTPNDIDLC